LQPLNIDEAFVTDARDISGAYVKFAQLVNIVAVELAFATLTVTLWRLVISRHRDDKEMVPVVLACSSLNRSTFLWKIAFGLPNIVIVVRVLNAIQTSRSPVEYEMLGIVLWRLSKLRDVMLCPAWGVTTTVAILYGSNVAAPSILNRMGEPPLVALIWKVFAVAFTT
jgi:hypothetical protein